MGRILKLLTVALEQSKGQKTRLFLPSELTVPYRLWDVVAWGNWGIEP